MTRPGFTLVEVVIASFLVLIVAGVLFASFFVPLAAVRSGKSQLVRVEEVAVFLARFTAEIAGVFPGERSFAGTPEGLSFLSSEGTGRGLVKVGYLLGEDAGSETVVISRAQGQPWEDLAGREAPVFQADKAAFSYYDGTEWLEAWDRPEIPRLVRLELERRGNRYQALGRPRTGTDSDADPDRVPGADGG